MSATPSDRDARIASILESITEGTYEVEDLLIADAVLERWRRFDVLAPEDPPGLGEPHQAGSADVSSSDASSR